MADQAAGKHRSATLVSIGDEIVAGDSLDTNSRWLASALAARGIVTLEHRTVGDDGGAIRRAIEDGAARADLVILTGGLGPTADDLTRDGLALALGERLVEDARALEDVARWFRRAGRDLSDMNKVQAMRPESASVLPNPNGTAPGLRARVGGADVFALPGPPHEMRPMFRDRVAPALRAPDGSRVRVLHTFGLGESDVASRLGDLLARGREPLVGITASDGVVSVRIRATGDAAARIGEVEREVRTRVGEVVFGTGDDTLASACLDALRSRGQTLATVESCTGGLLGATLTAVPGSSDAYAGGWVTYTDRLKAELVGVPVGLLDEHGAVSEPVARAMSEGGLERSGAGHAIAITGVAGPGGGTDAKPVGTVWVALASRGVPTDTRLFRFKGPRETVRVRSAMTGLSMLRARVAGADAPRLLWQVDTG